MLCQFVFFFNSPSEVEKKTALVHYILKPFTLTGERYCRAIMIHID